jgi:hypothetical protein
MRKLLKKNFLVINVVVILIAGIFGYQRPVYAGAWGESMAAAQVEVYLDRALRTFEQAVVASLKIQASKLVKDRLELLLTGTNGTAMYITNYEDFIYNSSQKQVQIYMDGFFNRVAVGISADTRAVVDAIEAGVDEEIFGTEEQLRPTIDDYVQGGAVNVYDQSRGGGLAALSELASGRNNLPADLYVNARSAARAQMQQQQNSAAVQAISGQGFIGKVNPQTNLIQTPGIVVKELTAFAESLPMQIMAVAESIPEIVGSMAAQVVTQTIQDGISKVTEPIDNQLRNAHNEIHGGMQELQRNIYEGVKFTN